MSNSNPIPQYHPKNYFSEDDFFSKICQRLFPQQEWGWVNPLLHSMGELSAQEISPCVLPSDQNPPRWMGYDARGNPIDKIEYHESYRRIAQCAYEFGIIGLGHSQEFRKTGKYYGPLLKFALGYLLSQSGSVIYCPICMTDGTLQLIERYGSDSLRALWVPRLTSLDWKNFADGAMYLTEIQGGSDVGANSCQARLEQGEWKLYGEKWFCSNAGSTTAMVLARPEGAPEGTRGLALFLVPRQLEDGTPNALRIHRLKEKLGTCEMATAEISLEGAVGFPVGQLDQGFQYMTDMLNLSRTYNAIWSIGLMRRSCLEAEHYAKGRMAFGKNIDQYPLVQSILARMKEETEICIALTFEGIRRMDRLERGQGRPNDALLLRLFTPLMKFYTAENCIENCHRGIEILGGNGCVEDFPLAKMLRDSQILAIWEGTANILSLDVLRVLKKSSAYSTFREEIISSLRDFPETVREEWLLQWESLDLTFQQVLRGDDGYGGQLQCRFLAEQLAQFVGRWARAVWQHPSPLP